MRLQTITMTHAQVRGGLPQGDETLVPQAVAQAKTNLSFDDPMPFLRGSALPKLASGMRSAIGRSR